MFRAAESHRSEEGADKRWGKLSYRINPQPNFANIIEKPKAANAAGEEQGQLAPCVIELRVKSHNNAGATQIQPLFVFILNYMGAEKKQSMAPKRSQKMVVEGRARQLSKWCTSA